jgi:hypothetical protein
MHALGPTDSGNHSAIIDRSDCVEFTVIKKFPESNKRRTRVCFKW